MDVRSVTEREMMSYRSDTTSKGGKDGLVFREGTILQDFKLNSQLLFLADPDL